MGYIFKIPNLFEPVPKVENEFKSHISRWPGFKCEQYDKEKRNEHTNNFLSKPIKIIKIRFQVDKL